MGDYQFMEREPVIVHMPKAYFRIGVVCTTFFCFLFILMLIIESSMVAVAFLGFTSLGIILMVATHVWKIRVFKSGDYFLYTTWLGRTYKIMYKDIVDITFNPNDFVFKTSNKTFSVSNGAVNLEFFIEQLDKNVSEDVLKKDHVVLRLSKVYLAVGAAFIILCGCNIIFMLQDFSTMEIDSLIKVVLSSAILTPLSIYWLLGRLVWKVRVFRSEDYFIYVSRLGRSYKVQYADIVSIKNKDRHWIVKTPERRLSIDRYATNSSVLYEMLKQKAHK